MPTRDKNQRDVMTLQLRRQLGQIGGISRIVREWNQRAVKIGRQDLICQNGAVVLRGGIH